MGVGDDSAEWAAAVAELSDVAAKSPEQWMAEREAALEQQVCMCASVHDRACLAFFIIIINSCILYIYMCV